MNIFKETDNFDHIVEAIESNNGYCTACKSITVLGGVEPDAQGYRCPECEQNTVIGVEEAVIRNPTDPDDPNPPPEVF